MKRGVEAAALAALLPLAACTTNTAQVYDGQPREYSTLFCRTADEQQPQRQSDGSTVARYALHAYSVTEPNIDKVLIVTEQADSSFSYAVYHPDTGITSSTAPEIMLEPDSETGLADIDAFVTAADTYGNPYNGINFLVQVQPIKHGSAGFVGSANCNRGL